MRPVEKRVPEQMPDREFIVTTSLSPTDQMRTLAREFSHRLGIPYVDRNRRGLDRTTSSGAAAIVVQANGVSVRTGESDFRYHPNMAKLRIMHLVRGKSDRMVSVMGLRSGDVVLDCTCGLGADAIVASFAVRESGRVDALEASQLLCEIVALGLHTYQDPVIQLVDAMRRVHLINAGYQRYLREARRNQYDIVYFDPMFDVTYDDSRGLDLVRLMGVEGAPSPDDIVEAARAARRKVVMKDRSPGDRLLALGFRIVSHGRKTCFGVIDV